MNKMSQRDAFWTRIYESASVDRDIVIVSADMGAPALDDFRKDLSDQFINAGIAEQNAIVIASGMALEGKKVFVYAIAPFITLRCLEQIRVNNAMMNIPITIVGVGAGFGYADSGPTHHMLEDISVLRVFPSLEINSITDSVMAAAAADWSLERRHTNYVRLEREVMPDIYGEADDFSAGISVLRESDGVVLIGTGAMTHTALKLGDEFSTGGKKIGVIDAHRLPLNGETLAGALAGARLIVTLEEHFLPGGLGSAVCETLQDQGLMIPVRRFGLDPAKGYSYVYGGREILRRYYGIAYDQLKNDIGALINETPTAETAPWQSTQGSL